MDFILSPKDLTFKNNCRAFAQQDLKLLAAKYGETQDVPTEMVDAMRAAGLFELLLPEELGGPGSGLSGGDGQGCRRRQYSAGLLNGQALFHGGCLPGGGPSGADTWRHWGSAGQCSGEALPRNPGAEDLRGHLGDP